MGGVEYDVQESDRATERESEKRRGSPHESGTRARRLPGQPQQPSENKERRWRRAPAVNEARRKTQDREARLR